MILTRDGLAAAGPKSSFSRINQPLAIRLFELVGKSSRDSLTKENPQMPQFSLTRSIKARRDLEARLRRNKLLHGRSAFVDRPDDGVRGRRLVPRLFSDNSVRSSSLNDGGRR